MDLGTVMQNLQCGPFHLFCKLMPLLMLTLGWILQGWSLPVGRSAVQGHRPGLHELQTVRPYNWTGVLARSELGFALRRYNEPTSEIGKAGRRIQSAFSRIVRTKLAVPQENAYEPSSGKGARQR